MNLKVFLIALGYSGMFMWPSETDANFYVANRVDTVIDNVPEYKRHLVRGNLQYKMFKNRETGTTATVRFVGSMDSKGRENTKVSGHPADVLIIDEYQLCNPKSVKIARGRVGRSRVGIEQGACNPRIQGDEADRRFQGGDQRFWNIPHCLTRSGNRHHIRLDFHKHFVNPETRRPYDPAWSGDMRDDFRPVCDVCGQPFNRHESGLWIPENEKATYRSYQLGKLWSDFTSAIKLYQTYMESVDDPEAEQAFQNNELGLSYGAQGTKIVDSSIDMCTQGTGFTFIQHGQFPGAVFGDPGGFEGPAFLGLDSGAKIHLVIRDLNMRMRAFGWIQARTDAYMYDFERETSALMEVMEYFGVVMACADADGEPRFTQNLQHLFDGMLRCDYIEPSKTTRRDDTRQHETKDERLIQMTRRSSMDMTSRNYRKRAFRNPENLKALDTGDYYTHLTGPTRAYNKDRKQMVWERAGGREDYFHCESYLAMARNVYLYLNGMAPEPEESWDEIHNRS